MATLAYRHLRGYTIDPGFSTQLDTMEINEMIYKIPWEELEPGPIGEYIEVVDLDPTTNYFYEPVNLDAKEMLSQQGVMPSEGDPKFHQQFVYTVMMLTIENFERSLGRRIIWKSRPAGKRSFYIRKLRVYPHAMRDANAFYSEEKMALLFGYFEAASKIQGSNFPGGTVFTCLSPDIVAHETTHAILDSIHPRYLENTNPDVPAFHEAFADIVALLQRFSNTSLVEHQLERTRGRLDEFSILGELATQFGQALKTGRGALRSAIGYFDPKSNRWKRLEPDPTAYQTLFEPHLRGALLVATIFDAFMRLHNFRTQDLIRIASQGTGVLPQGAIHPDLVRRLSQEATEIASHLLSICIRALDYCPPFDITFGGYLRALITADIDIGSSSENAYRVALIEAFRAWGIFPDRVYTLSAHSLCWKLPDLTKNGKNAMNFLTDILKEKVETLVGVRDRKKIWNIQTSIKKDLQRLLTRPASTNRRLWKKYGLTLEIWDSLLQEFGVGIESVTLKYHERQTLTFTKDRPLEVHSVQLASRPGTDSRFVMQVVISLSQTLKVKNGQYAGKEFSGGSTIVFSLADKKLKADYVIAKELSGKRRLKSQLDYVLGRKSGCSIAEMTYAGIENNGKISFEQLHFH